MISLKCSDSCFATNLSKILDITGKILTGRWLSFWFRVHSLNSGIMFANILSGKVDLSLVLLKLQSRRVSWNLFAKILNEFQSCKSK